MLKTALRYSAIVAAALLTASPVSAQEEGVAVYRTTMYSDASRTTVVGTIELSYCTHYYGTDGVQYHLEGTYTNYQEDELIGYCYYWDFYPI
jgi:hypothetical protein